MIDITRFHKRAWVNIYISCEQNKSYAKNTNFTTSKHIDLKNPCISSNVVYFFSLEITGTFHCSKRCKNVP